MKVTLDPICRTLSGRLGGLVYYQAYGRQYARSYVVPKNPNTPAQRAGRACFADAVKTWQKLPPMQKELWRIRGDALGRTGYNLFISVYMGDIKGDDMHLLRCTYEASPFLPVFSCSDGIVRLYERGFAVCGGTRPPP